MSMALEPILRTALRVLHVASFGTRNWTLPTHFQGVATQQRINDLWETLGDLTQIQQHRPSKNSRYLAAEISHVTRHKR